MSQIDEKYIKILTELEALSVERWPEHIARRCAGDELLKCKIEAALSMGEETAGGGREYTMDYAVHRIIDEHFNIPDRLQIKTGERFGDYIIQTRIGQGRTGAVFLAKHEKDEEDVAIKIIWPHLAQGDELKRFHREQKVLAALAVPGIISIYDSGVKEEGALKYYYFVMSFVKGSEEILTFAKQQKLDLSRRLNLFIQACEILGQAHTFGVIHRDIGTRHILVDHKQSVSIIDFGLARFSRPEGDQNKQSDLSTGDGIVGTPRYISPEQAEGIRDVRPASDVYSLGVVLFELITNNHPHDIVDKSILQILHEIRTEEPKSPSEFVDLPTNLTAIVMKCLSRDPADRYENASDLAHDLKRFVENKPVSARLPGPVDKIKKIARRHPAAVKATLGFFVTVSFFAIVSFVMWRDASSARDELLKLSDHALLDDLAARVESLVPPRPALVENYQLWLADAESLVNRLDLHRRSLAIVASEREKILASKGSGAEFIAKKSQMNWRHDVLRKLILRIESLQEPGLGLRDIIDRRLQIAGSVEERTVSGEAAKKLWSDAIRSIQNEAECPRYRKLIITPQVGLIPIGRDPASGLWEFADPVTGDIPMRDPNSKKLNITETTCIIFVLLPGGDCLLGASSDNKESPLYDPYSPGDEPVVKFCLDPFFISKYEMTQFQWKNWTGKNNSYYKAGETSGVVFITNRHPVETVNWLEAQTVFRDLGYQLPTKTQWEYACRAGTWSPWSTGSVVSSLAGYCNIADEGSKKDWEVSWSFEPGLVDGFHFHAPVGTYKPNAFGIHDMHGNVWEWLRDYYIPHDESCMRAGDGEIVRPKLYEHATSRSTAGGSYYYSAFYARSALWKSRAPEEKTKDIGVRPVRKLET